MKTSSSNLKISLIGLAVSAALPLTSAQASPASVQGAVRDELGAALPQATITAKRGSSATSAVSDASGRYELTVLAAGDYEIEVALTGFRSLARDVSLAEGETHALDFTLAIASFAEAVTVTRSEQDPATVPQAVAVVGRDDLQFGQRQVVASEALQGIPGLFAAHRHNFSMSGSLRLAIRAPLGSFGMKGLQLLQDGVPLTMADGTTEPTNLIWARPGRRRSCVAPARCSTATPLAAPSA